MICLVYKICHLEYGTFFYWNQPYISVYYQTWARISGIRFDSYIFCPSANGLRALKFKYDQIIQLPKGLATSHIFRTIFS